MTALVSANAAPATTTNAKPAIRPRAYVPGIEYKGNIEKAKGLIKDGKFAEAADVVRDNAFAPDFLIGDITRQADVLITKRLLLDFSDFALHALKAENIEKRAIRLSALLRSFVRFSVPMYFEERQKVFVAISAIGTKVPSAVTASCETIEADLKRRLTPADWAGCGFEVKSSNPGQTVYFHSGLNKTFVINTPKAKPASEAEKAKEREHKEGERRARQLERAAKFPGKVGVSGGKQSDDGGKKGKKKK